MEGERIVAVRSARLERATADPLFPSCSIGLEPLPFRSTQQHADVPDEVTNAGLHSLAGRRFSAIVSEPGFRAMP